MKILFKKIYFILFLLIVLIPQSIIHEIIKKQVFKGNNIISICNDPVTKENSITFIIPSKNRVTLNRTISSLKNLVCSNWQAIVISDGVFVKKKLIHDDRILFISIEKLGTNNFAAQIRNIGIKLSSTSWVAFVDDDDTLTINYLVKFYEHLIIEPDLDLIIFRMRNQQSRIFPPFNSSTFTKNRVGISFAVRKQAIIDEDIWFYPSKTEDFDFLDRLRTSKKKFIISQYITYKVKF